MLSEHMNVTPRDLAEQIMTGIKPVCNPKIKIQHIFKCYASYCMTMKYYS